MPLKVGIRICKLEIHRPRLHYTNTAFVLEQWMEYLNMIPSSTVRLNKMHSIMATCTSCVVSMSYFLIIYARRLYCGGFFVCPLAKGISSPYGLFFFLALLGIFRHHRKSSLLFHRSVFTGWVALYSSWQCSMSSIVKMSRNTLTVYISRKKNSNYVFFFSQIFAYLLMNHLQTISG